MKKLLFALCMLTGLAAFAPKAEAGQYAQVWNGRCYTYVHKSVLYGDRYCAPRPVYRQPVRHYHAPVRAYRSYDRGYHQRHSSRPRVSIAFGF